LVGHKNANSKECENHKSRRKPEIKKKNSDKQVINIFLYNPFKITKTYNK